MNVDMKIILRVNGISFGDSQPEWWRDTSRLKLIVDGLRDSGLWLEFGFFGKAGSRRLKAVSEIPEFLEKTSALKRGLYLLNKSNRGTTTCGLQMLVDPGRLSLQLVLGGADLEPHRETVIQRIVAFVSWLDGALPKAALLGPILGVEVFDVPYARVSPPRLDSIWPPGRVVDFISLRFHAEHPQGRPADVEKLLSAPVPKGASREVKGDLVTLRWVEDLVDRARVAAGLSRQELWWTSVLDLPVDPEYNALGDRREIPLSVDKLPPLTFYDPNYEEGYKATVVNPDGSFDEELLEEVAGWIAAGELPDQTPLKQVHLILPKRESAIRIRERARSIGVAKVLYTDEEGYWWDPEPPGEWISRPTES